MGPHAPGLLRSLLQRGRRAGITSASSTSGGFSFAASSGGTSLHPFALAAVAAMTTGGVVLAAAEMHGEDTSVNDISGNGSRAIESVSFADQLAVVSAQHNLPIIASPQILATSSNSTGSVELHNKAYDFIVVGNGSAGQSALRALSNLCPNASIAVIDPKTAMQDNYSNDTQSAASTAYIGQAVTALDHNERTIKLSDGSTLHFRQSILIATGCRGAPPPSSLIDDRAQSRILELRSTEAFGVGHPHQHHQQHKQRRPVMTPEGVRQMTAMAASQGARVCVMGSGVEALEMAATAAASSPDITRSGKRRKRKNNNNGSSGDRDGNSTSSDSNNDDAKVTLLFGGSGILNNRLPRYLSSAVAKRLKSAGIDVQSRSLVRYVAMHNHQGVEECEVHTAKSFDTMDTRRTRADLMILAPTIDGPRGTAVLPLADSASASLLLPSTFTPWSSMASGYVNCYVDDGRIAVNSELNAASRIFAAGSVAKFPSGNTGHATVAGEGSTNASLAGKVAAHNMARDYYERTPSRTFGRAKESDAFKSSRLFSVESCPIWRTDVGVFGGSDCPSSSSLFALGINALCVGNCDSETMATHGFFWTNQASDSRRRNTLARASSEKNDDNIDETNRGVSKGILARRRSTKISSTMRRSVYGSGVVFYLDRTGAIRGIMTWGLPFTKGDKDTDDDTSINPQLLSRMHEIIHTNGEILKPQHERAVFERDSRLDLRMLSSLHLSEESKHLAALALSSVPGDHTFNKITAQPLHRYVPSKPASITSIGMLKRRDEIGTGGVGEDLFARTPSVQCSEDERPPSLVHVYPMQFGSAPDPSAFWTGGTVANSNGAKDSADGTPPTSAISDLEAAKKAMKVDSIRSRPAKEEPLWLREGDAASKISMNDVLTDVFLMQVRRGRFSDGSDSVKQAPTPKMIENAKALLFGSEKDDDGVDEAEIDLEEEDEGRDDDES